MAEKLKFYTNADVYFEPTDLHSIEIIDSYSMRFVSFDGISLGDGGKYSKYAARFNEKIASFWSVATGIERLVRHFANDNSSKCHNKRVAVYNIDSSNDFVLKALKVLEENSFSISYKGTLSKFNKAFKQCKKQFTDIAFIGNKEERNSQIEIKSLHSSNSYLIEV